MKKLFTILALTIGVSVSAQTGNTSTGTNALANITTGDYNSAFGEGALYWNTEGQNNTASGFYSLRDNTTGNWNTASGGWSLENNTEGNNNTASGLNSLYSNTTGSYNTGLGYNARASAADATNQTVIGYAATGQADNSVVLGNSDVTAIYMAEDAGATVYAAEVVTTGDIIVGGNLTIHSDARLKANIISLGGTLSKLLLIDGKSYTMKKDNKQGIGVLAQDIEKVFPELVSETNGIKSVNYLGLVPVLINALKEQDSKMKEQEQRLERLEQIVAQLD
jgi:hypothetical protein